MANNYWGNLWSSFAPGGTTPIQALFGLSEDEGIEDYINDVYEHEGFDAPIETVSDPTPSDTSFPGADYAEELIDRINEASLQQQQASQSSADRAMEFEAEQAQKYMDFQAEYFDKMMKYNTEMSNSEIQRRMADLQSAGINPKLVAQIGGASTPGLSLPSGAAGSGHTASMSMSNMSALSGVLQTYITSANSLDRQNNGFVQNILRDILYLLAYAK